MTPYARLVEEKLRQAGHLTPPADLFSWLDERRSRRGQTWRTIAAEIRVLTGESPTDVTVGSWHDTLKTSPAGHTPTAGDDGTAPGGAPPPATGPSRPGDES